MKWISTRDGMAWKKPGATDCAAKAWLPLAEAEFSPSLLLDSEFADLAQLDALAGEFELLEPSGLVVVPWAVLEGLDAERSDLLGLPPVVRPTVRLVEFGAPSLGRYRIEARLDCDPNGRLRRDHGTVWADETLIGALPALWLRTLELVDSVVDIREPEARTEALFAIAKSAKEFDWLLPDSLASMVEVEHWRLEPEVSTPDQVVLEASWTDPSLDHLDPEAIATLAPAGGHVTERVGGKWKRIRIGQAARDSMRQGRRRVLRGQDVPRFIANPEAILGEQADAVDLNDFSKRVKGLLPAVYRSRPYIRAEPSGVDWFSVEAGAELENLDTPTDSAGVSTPGPSRLRGAAWRECVEQAVAAGESYVQLGADWVHVEDAAAEFKRLRALEAACPSGRVHASQLRTVLQIYENIHELEYAESVDQGPQSLPPVLLPEWFAIPLKQHQELGLRWLYAHYQTGTGAILADEMGVGKTAQMLALLSVVRGDGPSLVVAPAAVVAQWPDEAARFAPGLRVRVIERAIEFDPADAVPGTVWVVSYDALRRGQEWLARVPWCVVACDEAQRVKNKTAQITHVVKALKAKFRVAISGTPVENGLGELWNLFDLVRPSLLGCYREFASEFEAPIMRGADSETVLARLTKRTSPFILRRLKANHIPGLPALTTEVVEVACTAKQRAMIAAKIAELKSTGSPGIFLAYANWVQRCLFDPALVGGPDDVLAPKLAKTLEIVEEAWRKGERSIVVAEQLDVQERLSRALLQRYGTAPYMINGAVDTDERLRRVKAFAHHGCPALVLSPKAGGVGLNITSANHVILPTRLFNPAPEDQSIARAHRMGQQRDVHVYVLTAVDDRPTFDQKLHALLSRKRELASTTLYPIEKLGLSEKELSAALLGGG